MSADLSPHGSVNDTNVFVLEQVAVTNLIRNIWTGVLLPSTEEEFRARLSIPCDVEDLPQPIKELLNVCTSVNANCVRFTDETVINIINMAGNIYSYAQRVAGDGASYLIIFQSLRDMADHDSPYNSIHMSMFTLEIDELVRDATRYQSKAQATAKEVHRFHGQIKSDVENLKSTQDTVKCELDRDVVGDLDAIKSEIAALRAQDKELEAQAQALQAGGWMRTLIGLMTGPSLSAIEDRHKNIAAQIGELESTIQSTTEHQVDESLPPYAAQMIADMALMITAQESVNDLVSACGLAATLVDGMVTTWGDILDNLIRLESAVTGDPHVGAGTMLEMINQDEVKQKWNTVAERVKEFLTLVRAIGQEKANV
ncbi:hypothetical protein EV122DRAFT_223758 [Schizophyllum commune]